MSAEHLQSNQDELAGEVAKGVGASALSEEHSQFGRGDFSLLQDPDAGSEVRGYD